mmetsp:Transcript_64449/g.153819  ORF Transcript_64449/g.153819 Transcript_64449/m.153819 type:complete len:213 (-) Transcript_64449:843-1481(-)
MCSALRALPPFEVAVGGRSASLLGQELIWVHSQAHGAPSLAPLEASIHEDLVQAFGLRLLTDKARSWDNVGQLDVGSHLAALRHLGSFPKIFNARVCTRSNKDLINRNGVELGASLKAHVLQGPLHGSLLLRIRRCAWIWDKSSDRSGVLRTCAPSNCGWDVLAGDLHHLVILGTGICRQTSPICNSLLPVRTPWGHRSSFQVGQGLVIWSN